MHLISGLQPDLSVLYREIVAICFDSQIKHWTQSVGRMWNYWMLNPLLHKVTAGLSKIQKLDQISVKEFEI